MNRKITFLFLGILNLVLAFTLGSCTNPFEEPGKVEVTDMLGTKVYVKKNPSKVACISRTTYDLLVAYGLGDKIDGAYKGTLNNKWLKHIYPNSKNHYVYGYKNSFELFLERKVELVFAPEKYIADELNQRGIPAVCVSLYAKPNFEKYVTYFSILIRQIWDSEEVKEKSNKWEYEVEAIISKIKTTLEKSKVAKQKLYYVRGDKPNGVGYTDNAGSFTEYAYSILGFEYLGSKITTNRPSDEEILNYNPDVVVFGGIYQHTNLLKIAHAPFNELKAVKNGRLYKIPIGVTAFEQLSAMTPIFFAHQAMSLHPDLFAFDITGMLTKSIKEYFGYSLSAQDAAAMLAGLGPNLEPLL